MWIDETSLTIGVMLALSAYHMLVFLGRRKDLSNLAYSLVCLSYALRGALNIFFPRSAFQNEAGYYIMTLCANTFIAAAFLFFTHRMLELKILKKYSLIIGGVFLPLAAVLSTVYYVTGEFIFFQIILASMLLFSFPFFIGIIVLFFTRKHYRNRKKTIFMIGYLMVISQVLLLMICKGILNIPLSFMYLRFSVLLLAFIFAFALTDSFNRDHRALLDLTMNLEHKVQERTSQLREAHKQKTTFFINVAHEIRTPLTLIGNYLESHIKRHGVSAETGVMKRNVNKLLTDIVNILDAEKLEEGITFYDHDQTVNLSALIRHKMLFFGEYAHKKNIDMSTKIDEDVFLRIDPYAMDRLLNNLLDNALKYTPPGGKVEVSLKGKPLEEKIEVVVKDNGIGIESQKMKHIFEPFYQASHEKNNYQGLGMGLAIVKKILDECGAGIDISSAPGKGSEFRLIFTRHVPGKMEPAVLQAESSPSPPPEPVEGNSSVQQEYRENLANVLVVEDNRDMLTFLKEYIGREYNVFTAENGGVALQLLETVPLPHLILCDIMMDVMDGNAFFQIVSECKRFSSIPFIFLTAKASPQRELEGLSRGALDYITKPFSIDMLMAKIRSIIAQQERQRDALLNDLGLSLYEYLNRKKGASKTSKPSRKPLTDSRADSEPGAPFGTKGIPSSAEILRKLESEYGISKREMEVISYLRQGLYYKEIAAELNVSAHTVETYRKRIFKKCGIQNKIDLLRIFNPD